MCGILAYLSKEPIDKDKIVEGFEKVKARGPDNTQYLQLNNLFLGFHRLSINDLSEAGNQPLQLDDTYLICNGEIYNYKELAKEHNFNLKSSSDCEIILHLYSKFGFAKTLDMISGYFTIALYDSKLSKLFITRDPMGVRSLYMSIDSSTLMFCSEMKGITYSPYPIEQFPPGHYFEIDTNLFTYEKFQYYDYIYPEITDLTLDQQLVKIRDLFEEAVKKRFMTDRPFGVFLSGGFDSSLVAALVSKYNNGKPISTFSIGMEGSTDLAKARIVANHIKSNHTEILVTEKEMLDAIPKVICAIESYDTTTVRASTPMYLLSKYIKENTDIVVIFSGEGSDEAGGSYLYFHRAPSEEAFQKECVRLLKDLCYFDCLRCDKSTAGNGLEVRVPFLDKEFLREYMRVPASMKMPKNGMEKWFIRKAFEDYTLLPSEIIWRRKEAFSDGVSSNEKSWFSIIQNFVDTIISDKEFKDWYAIALCLKENRIVKYSLNPPILKESYYYREIFEYYYPGRDNTIPYYWLPNWTSTKDPSARKLDLY